MLANHIHDRSGLLPVVLAFGQQAQTDVACDEWMSSSPIYNWRNRIFLKMEGDDVSVALKGLQLDIGAPHNFLNFHYDLKSPEAQEAVSHPPEHARLELQADEKEHHDDAELGVVLQLARLVTDQSEDRADHDAGHQVAEHGPAPVAWREERRRPRQTGR